MRDDELIRLFTSLEAGVERADPEPSFAEELYRRLRTEAKRARPARAMLLALVALLVVGVVGGALVFGSGILPIPGPSETPAPSSEGSLSPSPVPSGTPAAVEPGRWVMTGEPANPYRDAQGRNLGEGFTLTLLPDGRVLMVGDVYLFGTSPGGAAIALTEIYTPRPGVDSTGRWAATPGTIGQAREHHTATLLADGRVLVAGGVSRGAQPVYTETTLGSAELYDPATGLWTATGDLGQRRQDHAAALLADGRVLVVGGVLLSSGGASVYESPASAEIYDPRSGTWSATAPLPDALEVGHSATLLRDGRVLVVGPDAGVNPLLFDPTTESWTRTAPMTERVRTAENSGGSGLSKHTAVLLPDGRVLIVGGSDGAGRGTPLAEIYDPPTNRWTPTGSMATGRLAFAAALLADGRVLAAGSGDGGFNGIRSAEIWDPATGTWAPTQDMLRRRGFHEGTPLLDGRVLVVGGYGGDQPWAEVYEPGGF